MLFPGIKDGGAGVEPLGRPDSLLPHPPSPAIGETPERGKPAIGKTPERGKPTIGETGKGLVHFPFISAAGN